MSRAAVVKLAPPIAVALAGAVYGSHWWGLCWPLVVFVAVSVADRSGRRATGTFLAAVIAVVAPAWEGQYGLAKATFIDRLLSPPSLTDALTGGALGSIALLGVAAAVLAARTSSGAFRLVIWVLAGLAALVGAVATPAAFSIAAAILFAGVAGAGGLIARRNRYVAQAARKLPRGLMLVAITAGAIAAVGSEFFTMFAGREPGWKWTAVIVIAAAVVATRSTQLRLAARSGRVATAGALVAALFVTLLPAPALIDAKPSSGWVVPPVLTRTNEVESHRVQVARALLRESVRHGVDTWFVENFGQLDGNAHLEFDHFEEHAIRPAAAEAFAASTALALGVLGPDLTTRAEAAVVSLVGSLSSSHWANRAEGGWSGPDSWQGALWAHFAGFAGWLAWDRLGSDTREQVAAMVVAEADRFVGVVPPYWRDRNGNEIFPGDSKAEENSWNAMLLQLAIAMMPNHPQRDSWADANRKLMLSAFATPNDLESSEVFADLVLGEWLAGTNMESDGTVINRSQVNPDYMTTIQHNQLMMVTSALGGQEAEPVALRHLDLVWNAFTELEFEAPPFEAPGGTIYREDASIYYPQGADWGTSRRMQFVSFDAFTARYSDDPAHVAQAWAMFDVHAAEARAMQQRGSDGRTYQDGDDDTYLSRESWVAMYAAWTALAIELHVPQVSR